MKRQRALEAEYEAQWDNGKGSHHPDYDPTVTGDDVVKASRETEELLNAIIKNDIKLVYKKIEEGADVNFVFGRAYKCEQGYTPLMCAAHRGRLECAKALLRSGADPNYVNGAGDLTTFWAIDGGVEMIKLLFEYGADLDAKSPKDWTPLSYAKACGKYGLSYEKGIYPEVSKFPSEVRFRVRVRVRVRMENKQLCLSLALSLSLSLLQSTDNSSCL